MKKVFNIKNRTVLEKNKYILFTVIFYMYIFQDFIAKYISIFKYFDELYAILFFPLILFKILKKRMNWKVKKEDSVIFLCVIVILVTGLMSNIVYNYQEISGVLIDILLVIKFILTIYTTMMLFTNFDIDKYKFKIVKHCKIIVIILFVIMILSYMFNWYDIGERYGIKIIKLFYSHPTVLVAMCGSIFSLLFWCNDEKYKVSNIVAMIMLILLMASTLRIKAIAFIGVILVLYIFIVKFKKKIDLRKILLIALIAIVIAFDQLYFYLIQGSDFARTVLMKTSFYIALDYFPLGTGFGTFASYISGVKYSPIYQIYNISNIYGLKEDNAPYVSDTFWPMILGQFGIIGFIAYAIIILMLFLKIQKLYQKQKKLEYFSAIIVLAYLMIASTAESAFVNPTAMPMAFLLAILLKHEKEES